MANAVAEEYSSSLADLTVNSKPLINMLTMLADDYIAHSPTIVKTVEAHLQKVPGDIKLPVLYLIDSIVKNVGKDYVSLFTQNIVSTFCSVFEQVDEKTRSQMFKLRQTWNEVFPSKKLYALDARVNSIDPAWPITAPPPRIHVNPKFLNTPPPPVPVVPEPVAPAPVVPVSAAPSITNITDTAMREELLKKRKELLELQKRKVELELLQTKAILEEQQKKLENQTATRISEPPPIAPPVQGANPSVPSRSELSDPVVSKEKPAEVKVEKSKFEGARRRDPRLHSRRENDPRQSSRKENQQFQRDPRGRRTSPTKPPSIHSVSEREEKIVAPGGEGKKATDSNSAKHEKRKSDKHKKHKDYKPRKPKMPFSGSSENKDKDYTKRSPKKSKQEIEPEKITPSYEKSIPDNLNSQADLVEDKREMQPSNENSDSLITKKELKEEKMEVSSTVPELTTIEKDITPLAKPSQPPAIQLPVIDLCETAVGSDNEPIPMEIDEKPMNISEDKVFIMDCVPPVFNLDDPSPLKPVSEKEGNTLSSEVAPPDLPLSGCGDTDLRLLPPQANSEPEQPPEKKSKSDIALFGVEDVDLRQTLVPLPPPPPIISKSESWANFKRSNSDKGDSSKSPKKRKSITSPRSSLFRKKDEDLTGQENIENDAEDRQNSLMLIMKEAEEQLKNESITYAQYNQMLKGVMSMNEENKLQEALRKDDYERIDSPESGSNSSSDAQHHFESSSPGSGDTFRGLSGDGKTITEENLSDKTSNLNDEGENILKDHDSRRRSRFKNHEPYSRSKTLRHGRYFNQNEPPMFDNKPWMSRQQQSAFPHRSRKEVGHNRWQYSHNRQKPAEYPVGPPARIRGQRHHTEISLPPADPAVLDLIDSDPMTFVTVANSAKEVRFYGENAIIMMDWDDPRDLMFQPGSRRVFIDAVDVITLQFNAKYREFTLNDGLRIRIRLGAPTRELFIDGRYYDVKFGGPPVEVNIGGRTHLIQLEGPLPYLNIGSVKRTDLVAGKINLIVDGKIDNLFPIYLDSKPQRFEINGMPFIIRFVDSLQTAVINGQPLKIPFGGIPVPIFFRGERHFLRLTTLPPGISPGFVNIFNMEGGRLNTPPPPRIGPPPPPIISDVPQLGPPTFMNQQPQGYEFSGGPQPPFPASSDFPQYSVSPTSILDKPVDVLTSLMPSSNPRFPVQNYQVEPYQEAPKPNPVVSGPPAAASLLNPSIDVIELYQKLVAMGVVPNQKNEKGKEEHEDDSSIKPVDFSKPETLKVRQPGLIKVLYSGIQCSSCGVRFSPEQTVKYSQHLDWHFRQNRRERHSSRIAQSRKWNYDVSDWIQYQEIEDDEDRAQSWFEIQDKKASGEEEEEQPEPTVSAKGFDEDPHCVVCRDRFDQFFNEDKEEWQLRRAVRVDDKLYHPLCLKDEQDSQGRDAVPAMMPVPEDVPIVTIDLDAAGDSGEDDKTANIETIDVESSSKSPEEVEDKPEVEEQSEIIPDTPASPETEETEHILEVLPEPEEIPTEDNVEKMDEDPSSPPSPPTEEKPEEPEEALPPETTHDDSDDDILAIEVIEPHIESYDILDDDDEEEEEAGAKENNDEKPDSSDDVKVNLDETNNHETEEIKTDIVIKTEPIDLVNTNTNINASHINETIYLDGNSEFSAPKITLPKKIKINISSVISKNSTDDGTIPSMIQDENSSDGTLVYDYTEPFPPGEEPSFLPGEEPPFPNQIKPNILETRMVKMPIVNKGKEMSGLCTIM